MAYRDCGLSFRKIGSRVGRNQRNVMRICDRWMQEGKMYRRAAVHRFTVCAYHSTPFSSEWSVRKTSIAWSTLDAEPLTSLPPMTTLPAAPPDRLWQRAEAAWSAVPLKNHPKSLRINSEACGSGDIQQWASTMATDSSRNHTSQKSINFII
ncbi:HTH_38 domain-containing protein [Trichonephila clavipes]|nr:HTH_38 domain-containing protein [Trichonephila clavipes]